jgi:hypothetical protein
MAWQRASGGEAAVAGRRMKIVDDCHLRIDSPTLKYRRVVYVAAEAQWLKSRSWLRKAFVPMSIVIK